MKNLFLSELKKSFDKIQQITDDCWAEISSLTYRIELNKNEHYSRIGESIKDLGWISDGILRIYYLNEKGEEWNKHFLQKGDFVASSISPKKKSITNIQALTESTILCISYYELMKLSSKYKEISLFIQKLTSSYLEQKQLREIRLLSENSLNNYLYFKEVYPDLENKIQHYNIARYLGITPTQLSRIRKKLSHQQM